MKKLGLLVMLSIALVACQSNPKQAALKEVPKDAPIIFIDTSFQAALQMATLQNKKIFVDFHAKWCKPCREMEAKEFSQTIVGEFYNRHFINLKVDIQTPEGKQLKAKYGIRNYPTIVFMDAKGESLLGSEGYIDAAMLLDFGKDMVGK